MPGNAWVSVLGLYNYDNTIFDNLVLPDSSDLSNVPEYVADFAEIDATTLKEKILFDLAELPLVYSRPETLKRMIGLWSTVNRKTWADLWETTILKYNPIWNKDGNYSEIRGLTKDGSRSLSRTTSGSSSEGHTGTIKDSGEFSESGSLTGSGTHTGTIGDSGTHTGTIGDSGSNSQTVENQVTGYDTNSYSPNKKDVTSGTTGNTRTFNESTGNTRTFNEGTSESNTTSASGTNGNTRTFGDTVAGTTSGTLSDSETTGGSESETVTRTETGNIGVTTTQQMIREQRDIVVFNMYEHITNAFKKQFCIMIW